MNRIKAWVTGQNQTWVSELEKRVTDYGLIKMQYAYPIRMKVAKAVAEKPAAKRKRA